MRLYNTLTRSEVELPAAPGPAQRTAMDLLEYQGKRLFAKHGVTVPEGRHAATVDEAVEAAEEVGYPCVIKAQVAIGKRGKAGGIKVAKDREEAREHAEAILGMDIRGFTVHELWVEEASEIAGEYYASIVFDRSAKAPLAMLSTRGGMDIEAVAQETPEAIATLHVDPLLGFQAFHGRRLAFEALDFSVRRHTECSSAGRVLRQLCPPLARADQRRMGRGERRGRVCFRREPRLYCVVRRCRGVGFGQIQFGQFSFQASPQHGQMVSQGICPCRQSPARIRGRIQGQRAARLLQALLA